MKQIQADGNLNAFRHFRLFHEAAPLKLGRARRATAATAKDRNRYVVSLADAAFIPHATPGGSLDCLVRDHLATGHKRLWTIDDPANANLLAFGATPVSNPSPLIEMLNRFGALSRPATMPSQNG